MQPILITMKHLLGKNADLKEKHLKSRAQKFNLPKTEPPIAASPPILTPASSPTGPPRHVPSNAPATG
jgi:hypothetical protein